MAMISALIPSFIAKPRPKLAVVPSGIEMHSFGCCDVTEKAGSEQVDALARLRASQVRSRLLANSLAAAPAPRLMPDILSKVQLSALLGAIHQGLHLERQELTVRQALDGVLSTLELADSEVLSLEDWASLSLQLDALCARLAQLPLPLQESIAPSHFVRLNLNNLAKVSRYIWTRQARESLVATFAAELAQQRVTNPALADSQSSTFSAELGCALPILKAGLELNRQALESFDEDGNFVTTSAVGCGGSVKAGAAVLAGQARLGGALGLCFYAKNWHEHANYRFNQLLAQHRDRPDVAHYLSRAACLEGSAPMHDEIADIDQLEADYALQQRTWSRQFSLLVSSQLLHQPAQAMRADSQPRITLGLAPSTVVKPVEGVVTTLSGAAGGSVGIDFPLITLRGGAQISGQSKTIRYRSMETLCDQLKSDAVDPVFKAGMIRQLATASRTIRAGLMRFWGHNNPLTATEQVDRLNADIGHYFRLHAWQQAGHAEVAASITAFNQAYGANNTDQCLRNMVWMVAFLYSELIQQHPTPAVTQCRQQLLAIEASLHHPSIAHTKGYLAQHAAASQTIKYTSNEVVLEFSINADGVWVPVNLNGSVKFTYCRQEKTSALVAGDKVQVDVTLGADPALNQRLLRSVNDYFCQNLGMPVTADMIRFFNGPVPASQVCTSWQFLKATDIAADLAFVELYERQTVTVTNQFGSSLPVSVTGLGALTLAGSQTNSQRNLLHETPGSGTILYYARHFMHALASGKMDRQSRIVQRCYWQELEQKHQAALTRLFLQYAADYHNNGYLMRELDAIGSKFLSDTNDTEVAAWDTARSEFLTMADQLALCTDSDNYEATLQAFKNLLQLWYPHWKRDKDRDRERDGKLKYRTRRWHLG